MKGAFARVILGGLIIAWVANYYGPSLHCLNTLGDKNQMAVITVYATDSDGNPTDQIIKTGETNPNLTAGRLFFCWQSTPRFMSMAASQTVYVLASLAGGVLVASGLGLAIKAQRSKKHNV